MYFYEYIWIWFLNVYKICKKNVKMREWVMYTVPIMFEFSHNITNYSNSLIIIT